MSEDKPINAMYGSKMKLDLDKVKTNSKDEEKVDSTPDEEVVDEVVKTEEAVEETADEAVGEESEEAVADDADEVVEEETADKPQNDDSLSKIDSLKKMLDERDNKLSNQSNELNYLTNKVIPKLKKEISDLNGIKNELSDALEKSTKKYFDQLDINADLSGKIGKLGADSAVNKVRADKLEAQLGTIKEDLESKISEYKDKLTRLNVDEIKQENSELINEVDDLKTELENSKKENSQLSDEVSKLQSELIEIGNYKDEVDKNYNKELTEYKEEVSSLKAQLKVKTSSYDKLSNESKRTISDLNKQIKKLEEELDKQSNRGLFDRFK